MTSKAKTTETRSNANGWMDGWDNRISADAITAEGRETFDSLIKASTIATQGYGAVGLAWLEFAKTSVEQGAEAGKTVMGARNWNDMVAAQSDFAKASMERYVAESNRITEMAVKTTNEAMLPIRERVETAVSRYAKQPA